MCADCGRPICAKHIEWDEVASEWVDRKCHKKRKQKREKRGLAVNNVKEA